MSVEHIPHMSTSGANNGGNNVRTSTTDFVSADVNEALQEAREIVTEGRARDNPKERLIEDSTSVKVTKMGTRFDPVEVIVSRRRVVSQASEEEDDIGSYSDSDLHVLSRRRATSTHQCNNSGGKLKSGSHETLLDSVSTEGAAAIDGGRHHTNVRYRRGGGSRPFWTRAEEQSSADGGSGRKLVFEDDAQLEIDVKEECCTDDGAHLIRKEWEARWTVQHFDLLPEWLQDNEFLRTGHRPPLPSFAECFKSILTMHTETGNIWTHLIGCVAFFILGTWFLIRNDAYFQFQEKLVFSFFFLGAIVCLGLSFTFHTVSCHSIDVVRIFSKLDYMGISLLIIGSFIPWIYYSFYCRPEPKITYISMVVILGIGAVIVSLWDKFSESRFRPVRAAVFVTMGLSGIVPMMHFAYTDGMWRLINENSFYWLMAMAGLYLFGTFLYATRTPERFFPGKFDYWFQSHQLFHVCVVCAAFAHYYGISEMALNRLRGTCDLNKLITVQRHDSGEL